VVQVSSAPNGLKITPTFTIKLTTASNNDTLNDDSLNQTYDSSAISGLGVKPTVVSAAPSVGISLVKGQTLAGANVFGTSSNALTDADDIGAITVLAPLPGRASSDYRGSAFPTGNISYTLSASGTYISQSGSSGTLTSAQMASPMVNAYAPGTVNRTTPFTYNTGSGYGSQFTKPLPSPNANTGQIYTTPPTGPTAGIGDYNSGSFNVTSAGSVTNNGYAGVYNPYTYNMTGNIAPTAVSKSFSSLEMILGWDRTTTDGLANANGWSQYTYNVNVATVTFNNAQGTAQTVTNSYKNTLSYSTNVRPTGTYTATTYWTQRPDASSGKVSGAAAFPNLINGQTPLNLINYNKSPNAQPLCSQSGTATGQNYGDDILYQNEKVSMLSMILAKRTDIAPYSNPDNVVLQTILMWDPSAFVYDPTAGFDMEWGNYSISGASMQFGVAKDPTVTAPYTYKVLDYDTTYNTQYTWYNSWSAVVAAGAQNSVGAVALAVQPTAVTGNSAGTYIGIPAIVKSGPGAITPNGNHLVLMSTDKVSNIVTGVNFDPILNMNQSYIVNNTPATTDANGNTITAGNPANVGIYFPTTFNSNGTVNNTNGTLQGQTYAQQYWNQDGDSAFVQPYSTTSRTTTDQKLYDTSQSINITVVGNFQCPDRTVGYGGSLTTTLPPGITYKSGSSTDAKGNPMPDPTITTTGSGATLQQVLAYNYSSLDMVNGETVHFQALPNIANLTFDSTGSTGVLTVTSISAMWLSSQTPGKDTSGSSATVRSSSDWFQEKIIQALTINKDVDKTAIEDGNKATVANDPASDVPDTSITYSLTVSNMTAAAMSNVNVLDVLPYNGDSRGTLLSGGYTVTKVASSDSTVKYSTNTTAPSSSTYNESSDPATITTGSGGWTALA
ncbi:MAG: hypothetical protein WAX22_09385, partial [Lactococcus hircilactis]